MRPHLLALRAKCNLTCSPSGRSEDVLGRQLRQAVLAGAVRLVASPVPGLHWMGLPWQTRVHSSLVDGVDRDARRTARHISVDLCAGRPVRRAG